MLSDALELAAYAAFVVAGWLVAPALGLALLGTALWLLAQATDGAKVTIPKVKVPKVLKIRVKAPRVVAPKAGARAHERQPAR